MYEVFIIGANEVRDFLQEFLTAWADRSKALCIYIYIY